jgi:bacterioferritin
MQGNQAVIDLLNDVLAGELAAINQYFLDAKMCDNWGYQRLGARFRDDSISEMKDADELIERILYLEGHPNIQGSQVRVGGTVPEKLALALELERQAITRLNRGIAVCAEKGDNGSRELLVSILEGEERHADWLESQLALIGAIGDALYLAQQIHG